MKGSAKKNDAAQNALHRALSRYVNGGYWRRGGLPDLLLPRRGHKRVAEGLVRDYAALRGGGRTGSPRQRPVTYSVPRYAGGVPEVHNAAAFLADRLSDDLVAALVHGSLGSYEAVPYSDFDALVILKDAVMEDPDRLARVARDLCRATGYMIALDPLQHHGWFVLTEYDLQHHCEAYFPSVLFGYAKSLLPGDGATVELRVRPSHEEARGAFDAVATAVRRKLEAGFQPRGGYALKLLLSQFMLLPALYVQVRDGRGIWKGDSFRCAAGDFEEEAWASMEAVSQLRREWASGSVPPYARWALSPGRLGTYVRSRLPIPPALAERVDAGLLRGMLQLVRAMQDNLAAMQEGGGRLAFEGGVR